MGIVTTDRDHNDGAVGVVESERVARGVGVEAAHLMHRQPTDLSLHGERCDRVRNANRSGSAAVLREVLAQLEGDTAQVSLPEPGGCAPVDRATRSRTPRL